MNESINIPAILKGKPQGTKLHDSVRGIDVYFAKVDDCNKVHCTFEENELQMFTYSSKGTLVGFEDGMVVLVPSEEMRDWNKFDWKKGDILVCIDGKCKVIFDKFDDDHYTSFVGKHYLESYGKDGELLDYEEIHFGSTANYTKDSDETIQCYINTIEERLGGKLNRETLEIEKPKFKDGDIVSSEIRFIDSEDVIVETYIVHNDYLHGEKLNYYAGYNSKASMIDYNSVISPENTSVKNTFLRLATEEEKQQLFDALAKEGKAWDSEHKMIVKQLVPGNLYYFEMENELAYIAKLKEAKGGEFTFESNVSWCPRNSQNDYDYEEGSFTVLDKDCYGFREANADECKIFEKFLVEQAMKSFKFKALDYVLCKSMACYEGDAWNLFQYAYQNKDGAHIMVGGAAFIQCIPYVGNEELLGTTKSFYAKK